MISSFYNKICLCRKGLKELFFPYKAFGPKAEKPDMTDNDYEFKKAKFLKSLLINPSKITDLKELFSRKKRMVPTPKNPIGLIMIMNLKKGNFCNLLGNPSEITDLERKTTLQADYPVWREKRRKLLTPLNFGAISNNLPLTSCKNIVKNILYSNINVLRVRYVRIHEKEAVTELEARENIKIIECGLFTDQELNFLGASLDDIVKDNDNIIIRVLAAASHFAKSRQNASFGE